MNIFTKQSGQGLALDDYLARPVQLTAAAAKFVKQIMREQRFGPTAYLRVGAKPQEPGVWHELDVMDAPVNPASDYVSESFGVRLVVSRRDAAFLIGIQIDYGPHGNQVGFVFENRPVT